MFGYKNQENNEDRIKRLEGQIASLQKYNQSLQDKMNDTEGTLDNFFKEKQKAEAAISKILVDFEAKFNRTHLISSISMSYDDMFGRRFWIKIKTN